MSRCLSLSAALLLLLGSAASALYLRQEIEKVPVARLAQNLEDHLKKNPKDIQARFNLARLHAMAFSLKTDQAEIRANQPLQGPWFGYEPRPVPFEKVVKTDDASKQDAARKHLEKAINLYSEVVKEKPDHLIAQLGRAWCIAQRGSKEEAIKEYRKVVELAWPKEKELRFAGPGFHAITAETTRYLLPLLDADKDKEEIATLKQRVDQLSKLPRAVTPIALPLRDGMTVHDMVDLAAQVSFDADGSGLARRWSWITPRSGWLVHDPKQSGKITSALQMFGAVTFWCFWEHGYQALAALDDDGDGWLRGSELAGLAVWCDRNGDGVSDPGEVRTLAEWDIVALSCRSDAGRPAPHCAAQARQGVVFRDGTIRPTFDIILRQAPAALQAAENKETKAAVEKGLRWLALHQAPDGHWSLDQFNKFARTDLNSTKYTDDGSRGKGMSNDTAGTAFGVLPFLAAGITHRPTGKPEKDTYVKTVRNGLSYLMQKQQQPKGSFPGDMYTHALATFALCEAYGMTLDPMLKPAAQRAVQHIITAQDPQGGGWRYQPRQGSDTSVTGYQLLALRSAQNAGFPVPAATLKSADRWLASCKAPDGGYGYTGPTPTVTMTAVGMLCKLLLGTPPRNPDVQKALELFKKQSANLNQNRYLMFWGTLALHQMGEQEWTNWYDGEQGKKGAREKLLQGQEQDGSWNPAGDPYGTMGGRVMVTSMTLLALQADQRHLPLFRRGK